MFLRCALRAGGLLGAGTLLAACGKTKSAEFHAVDITGIDYARDFHLTDFNGQQRGLADFRGDVVAVFFGYTQCPDVCPTTLADLTQTKRLLGSDGERLQVVFISLDPERDTPDVLRAYMQSFDPDFLGLSAGSTAALDQLVMQFKIFYQKVEGEQPGQYSVDHTAATYVYDPQGKVRLFVRYGTSPREMADDIRQLLNGA